MELRCRSKLLLLVLLPLVIVAALINGIYLSEQKSDLASQIDTYRSQITAMKKQELQTALQLARTAIADLYEADINGNNIPAAKARLVAMRFGEDGYFFAYNSQGVNTLHAAQPTLEGKNLIDVVDQNGVRVIAGLIDAAKRGDGFLNFSWHKPSINATAPKLGYAEYLAKWDWVLATGVYVDDIEAEVSAFQASVAARFEHQVWLSVSVTLTVVVLVAALVAWLTGRALQPLSHMLVALQGIAAGGGDLTARLQVESRDEIGELAAAFNQFMAKLQQLIGEVQQVARHVSDASGSLQQQTEQAGLQMDEHHRQTELVVTAVTELSVSAREVANNTVNTATATQEATAQTEAAQQEVDAVVNRIDQLAAHVDSASQAMVLLNTQTTRISSVLTVIGDIAAQTNLLALNAAIEAARAGEQGRGFAVVADEVRSLAGRTQQSTEEINQMLAELQSVTREAVQAMTVSQQQSQETLAESQRITASLVTVTDAVNSINAMGVQTATAAEEQSAVSEEINTNMVAIQHILDQIVGALGHTRTTTTELAAAGEQMRSLVGQFKV